MIRYGEIKHLRWRGRLSEKLYVRVYRRDEVGATVSRSWRCTGFSDPQCAEAQVKRWQLQELCPPAQPSRPSAVIEEAARQWAAARGLGRSHNYRRILVALSKEWGEAWGRRDVRSLTTADVVARVQERLTAGIKASTLNLEIRNLRACFAWAVDQGWCDVNPVRQRMVIPIAPRTPRVINDEEEARLLGAAAGVSQKAYGYVLCLIQSGFRGGLADRVKWEHVDFDHGVWCIPGALLKGRRDYCQPIAPLLLAWLREHRREQGSIWSTYYVKKWLSIRVRAGLPTLRRHDLRRTFITRCRQANVPIEVTMALSDHRDVGVMLRLYRAIDQSETRQALDRVFGNRKREVNMRYVLCLALLAAGCAKDHDHGPASPFAGLYEGTWDSTRTEESGEFSCSIDTAGTFTAIYENAGVLSRFNGVVAPDGQYTGTITPPSGPSVPVEGLLVLMDAGIGGRMEQVGVGLIATFQALRQ